MKPNQKENEPQTLTQKQIDEYFKMLSVKKKNEERHKKYSKRRQVIMTTLAELAIKSGITVTESEVTQRVNARPNSYPRLDLESAVVKK